MECFHVNSANADESKHKSNILQGEKNPNSEKKCAFMQTSLARDTQFKIVKKEKHSNIFFIFLKK